MTRINCVPVQELTNKHLLAEYRELPRVFGLAQRAYQRGEDPATFPQEYLLGKGHVRFFYARLEWLTRRWTHIYMEMRGRRYQPMFNSVPQVHLPTTWWQDWEPTAQALFINRQRIAARLAGIKE